MNVSTSISINQQLRGVTNNSIDFKTAKEGLLATPILNKNYGGALGRAAL